MTTRAPAVLKKRKWPKSAYIWCQQHSASSQAEKWRHAIHNIAMYDIASRNSLHQQNSAISQAEKWEHGEKAPTTLSVVIILILVRFVMSFIISNLFCNFQPHHCVKAGCGNSQRCGLGGGGTAAQHISIQIIICRQL